MDYRNFFTEKLGYTRCFTNILAWMHKYIYNYDHEWIIIQEKTSVFRDLEECYFEMATDCYRTMIAHKGNFTIQPHYIKFHDGSMFLYRPLDPIVFNGLIYAICCLEHLDSIISQRNTAKRLQTFLDKHNQTASTELFNMIHHYYEHETPRGFLPISCKTAKQHVVAVQAVPAPKPKPSSSSMSNCFAPNLKSKQSLFVDSLRKVEPTIGKRNGRTWGHVMEAFKQMHFIDEQCVRAEFARAIAEQCPNLKAKNVEQALKRFYEPISKDRTKEANIIADIAKQFQPVLDAIKP